MTKGKSAHCDHSTQLFLSGFRLKPVTINKLEAWLKTDPSDLSCRLELLGYYFKNCHTSKIDARKQQQCVLWMIEHMPENRTLSVPWARVEKDFNPTGYEKCKRLWLKQLAKQKDNVVVITNAAGFLQSDSRIVERLYRRANVLEPTNPRWSRNLALFLRRGARKNGLRMRKALAAIQDALQKTKDPSRKFYLYDDLAEIAYDLGEWAIAGSAARKSVSSAQKYLGDWYYGNAIHDGNCVLGRLALHHGNFTKAIFHLKEAGKTPGSAKLNSFGPNMLFAQEMLRAGQREPVIEYLEACKRFWKGKTQKLSACISQIERGKSPQLPRVI